MKKLLSIYFIGLLSLLVVEKSHAQDHVLDTLTKRLEDHRRGNYQEKIYLHLNQTTFLVGETIWFSAYVTDATAHLGSKVSKVAYVEVLDRNNVPVVQGRIDLREGLGNGSFYLSPLINSGNYVIRAYTSWMRNQRSSFYFHKPITIINAFTPLEKKKATEPNEKIVAAFFPEGGNLIAGAPAKVGYRITNAKGKGLPLKGVLLNDKNDTIARFSPLKAGIGSFVFQPEAGGTYRAFIKNDKGDGFVFDLPQVQTGGHTLSVVERDGQFQISVENRTGMRGPSFMIVHSRNRISHSIVLQDPGKAVTTNVSKAELYDGISCITIFNSMLQPVAERLIYKRPTRTLSIAAKIGQPNYSPRRPVTLQLETSFAANLSISIYRKDSLSITDGSTILDYLMLSSDLQGVIESPEYYLSEATGVNDAIDNLMLTHGWRRFQWQDVLQRISQPSKFIPEFHGPILTARVLNENNEPASNVLTYLATPSASPRIFPSRSNSNGLVQFDVQNLYGPRKLVIQTNNKIDSTYHFEFISSFSDEFATVPLADFTISRSLKDELEERSVAMQVADIYHRARLEKFTKPLIDTIPFYGKPDESYLLDDFTRFPVMEEVMREYVPGVLVRKRRDGFHFMVIDNPNKTAFNSSPLMLIDGVPFFDEDEIMSFDPLKVKRLDVMTQRYYLGLNSYPGVVSYRTYQGDLGGFRLNKHAMVVDFDGLQLQREFYVPKYDIDKERESRLPDQRQQLYWNPNVSVSKDGRHQLNFSTSDLTGEYVIEVQGLSKDGDPGFTTTTFSVKSYNN